MESSFLYVVARTTAYHLLPEAVVESLLFGPLLHALLETGDREQLDAAFPNCSQDLLNGVHVYGSVLSSGMASCTTTADSVSGSIRFLSGSDVDGKYAIVSHPEHKDCAMMISLDGAERESEAVLDASLKRTRVSLNAAPCVTLSASLTEALRLRESLVRAAEICGACDRVLQMARGYVEERKQFDVPIGGFQAVQHKLVDAYVAIESLDALLRYAAWALDHAEDQAALAVQSALWKATREGSSVIESLLQIHGGIGFTWEYDLHLFLRRVKSYEALYKPTARSREQILAAARN